MKIFPKTIVWLVGALLLLALGMVSTFWSYQQIAASSTQRQHTQQVISAANALMFGLTDAETGQRGYALTGNESYLRPYLAVRDTIVPQLQMLRKLSQLPNASIHLDALVPMVQAKMTELAHVIDLRRAGNQTAVRQVIEEGTGKRNMDNIRQEMAGFIRTESEAQARNDDLFNLGMRRMFLVLSATSALALLFAGLFAYFFYQKVGQQAKDVLHAETSRLLDLQEESNRQLVQANCLLQEGEQKLSVTLNSIGDAVISTDAGACVTMLNPVAEELTGWTRAQALGHPIDEVFHIVNKDTRALAKIPVADALMHGTVQGLANHIVLIARDAREFDISDSCAPIRDAEGQVVGAVLVFRNVTVEYAAQQAMRDSAALVQTILNTVVDGLVTIHAHGGIIETTNPAIELMFGYSDAELSGKSLSLLIPELDQEQHNVSLNYYGVSDEARAIGVGREVIGRRKNGSAFPLEIAVSEMTLRGQRYFTGILRDITARKAAEEALVKAGALQKAIFDSANFSSIATDAKGVIQIFNVGAERMLGYTAAEVMNIRTPADISDPQEVIERAKVLSLELATEITPGFEALVFKAARGIEDIYELTYIRKDGSRFPAVVSVTALRDEDNAIIGYLLIGTDNTARKAAEVARTRLDQVLRDKNVELESARQVADKANLAKSEFLSGMSHELRSPLNAILGFAQLMESGSPLPTPSQKASIGQILRAGWYLLDLINEVLDLALIESGRLSLSVEPILLSDVLDDCRTMIDRMAFNKKVHLYFPVLRPHCFVAADRTRLKQVVINLLSNAIKYNREGGRVDVTCSERPSQRLRICVQDTGEGLSAADIAQLFQPFNRLGKENSAEEGTGIGLVVSKRLVGKMGGCVGVNSTLGVGSSFWIELALAGPPQLHDDITHQPVPLFERSPDSAAVRTLLYVEDNRANMELVEQLTARRTDLRLLGAGDAISGIALARAHLPDVILMDINLPGINGMQALAMLREDPLTQHIPVLALSANAMLRDIERGLAAGFFRYLTKPIRVSEFMAALDEGLKKNPV